MLLKMTRVKYKHQVNWECVWRSIFFETNNWRCHKFWSCLDNSLLYLCSPCFFHRMECPGNHYGDFSLNYIIKGSKLPNTRSLLFIPSSCELYFSHSWISIRYLKRISIVKKSINQHLLLWFQLHNNLIEILLHLFNNSMYGV